MRAYPLAGQVRAFAKEIAKRHPGKSVELRIPPLIAVQIGIGETRGDHRRGTPSSVVELSPELFLELCAGTRSWKESAPDIRASGIRSDLSEVFPVQD